MSKKTKKIICIVLCCVLGAGAVVGLGFGFAMIPYCGTKTSDTWVKTQVFDVEKDITATFEITESKHEEGFVIMNFADVQLVTLEKQKCTDTLAMMKSAIEQVNPDLITLTGDQVSGGYKRGALKDICELLDSTGIPWAPVLGNHDGQGNITRNGNGDIYLRYKNVVFRKNDPDLGVGNYVINLTTNGNPVHAVFMVDSHDSRKYENKKWDYDYIWENQIDWYEWVIRGEQKINPGIKSSCFFHIPLPQYNDAWEGYQNGIYEGKNEKRETICCANHDYGTYDSGFYDRMKALGSTDLVVAGHDHVNNFYVEYNGITLAYGMKSGYGSYTDADMIGVTTVTIAKDGSHSLDYLFYNKDTGTLQNK